MELFPTHKITPCTNTAQAQTRQKAALHKGPQAPDGQMKSGQSMSTLFPCASHDFYCVST